MEGGEGEHACVPLAAGYFALRSAPAGAKPKADVVRKLQAKRK
jgi:hypothetical protein